MGSRKNGPRCSQSPNRGAPQLPVVVGPTVSPPLPAESQGRGVQFLALSLEACRERGGTRPVLTFAHISFAFLTAGAGHCHTSVVCRAAVDAHRGPRQPRSPKTLWAPCCSLLQSWALLKLLHPCSGRQPRVQIQPPKLPSWPSHVPFTALLAGPCAPASSPGLCLCLGPPSYKDTSQQIWAYPTPVRPQVHLIAFAKIPFPNEVPFGFWMNIDFGRHNSIQPTFVNSTKRY